ncbi:MAG: tetratricopeptide repeat protein [Candidatus Obscuribacterales bacterium]|nr:tetratricopeptide repeat protein [Candidatus Obscuribacterales bacterium]
MRAINKIKLLSALVITATQIPAGSQNESTLSAFQTALYKLEADKAILCLSSPLNKALAKNDRQEASKIMQAIAHCFALDENYEAALQAAQIAAKLNPVETYPQFQSADFLFRCGQWQESEKLCQKLAKSRDPLVALKAEAVLAQQQGSLNSLDLLQKYSEKSNTDLSLSNKLANLYTLNGQSEEAAKTLKKVAASVKSAYLKEIFLGRAAEKEKKNEEAKSFYKKAGLLNPHDPLWHFQLAMIAMRSEKIKEADLQFKEAFKCKRLNTASFNNWALMEAFFGKTENAEAALNYLEKLRPQAGEVHFVKATVFEKKGQKEKAREELLLALKANPHNSSIYLHLTQEPGLEAKKKLSICRDWVKDCPNSWLAAIELGRILLSEHKYDEALASFLKAREIMQESTQLSDPSYRNSVFAMHAALAALLFKKNEMTEALKEAIKFNELRPELPDSVGLKVRPRKLAFKDMKPEKAKAQEHAALADCLFETRFLDDAESEYRKAIELDPDQINYHSFLLKVLIEKKDFIAAGKEDAYVSQHIITHIPGLFKGGEAKKH